MERQPLKKQPLKTKIEHLDKAKGNRVAIATLPKHVSTDEQPRLWRLIIALFLTLALSLPLTACASRSPKVQVLDLPKVPTLTEPRQLTSGRNGTLTEVAPPAVIIDLNELIADQAPSLRITSPRSEQVIDDTSFTAEIRLRGFSIYREENIGLGPHVQISLDNQPARTLYDLDESITFADIEPGTHTLRAIAIKPWGESYKNDEAFAETTFHLFAPTQANAPEANQPELIYSQPQGTYTAEPILLDFQLNNAPLHLLASEDDTLTDWKIRCDINGQSFTFNQWQPIYLRGFKPGQNWVHITLVDVEGKPIENTFNSTVRLINYDPSQSDTLGQLMRGELPLRDVGKIVNLDYVPPALPVSPSAEDRVEPPAEPFIQNPVEAEPVEAENAPDEDLDSALEAPIAAPTEKATNFDVFSQEETAVEKSAVEKSAAEEEDNSPALEESTLLEENDQEDIERVEPQTVEVEEIKPEEISPADSEPEERQPAEAAPKEVEQERNGRKTIESTSEDAVEERFNTEESKTTSEFSEQPSFFKRIKSIFNPASEEQTTSEEAEAEREDLEAEERADLTSPENADNKDASDTLAKEDRDAAQSANSEAEISDPTEADIDSSEAASPIEESTEVEAKEAEPEAEEAEPGAEEVEATVSEDIPAIEATETLSESNQRPNFFQRIQETLRQATGSQPTAAESANELDTSRSSELNQNEIDIPSTERTAPLERTDPNETAPNEIEVNGEDTEPSESIDKFSTNPLDDSEIETTETTEEIEAEPLQPIPDILTAPSEPDDV